MFKVVFLDMDNTIAENKTCKDVEFSDGLYEKKRPISFVIDAINYMLRKEGTQIVIATTVQGGDLGIQEKLYWLEMVEFEYDDILFINETTSKSEEIIRYCSENDILPQDCLLIDDKKVVLQDAEMHGFKVMYPQQLLVDYYEWLQNQDWE